MHVSVKFIPNYLEDAVLQHTKLNMYDSIDARDMNKLMYSAYVTGRRCINCTDEPRARLIDYYYKPGDFVFNDDSITMSNDTVFKIHYQQDIEYDDHHVVITCGSGSTNVVVLPNRTLQKQVTSWLVDYLIKRLGVEVVIKTNLFEDYWLRNNATSRSV